MVKLEWRGRDVILSHHENVPLQLLKKIKSKSLGNSENKIIQGDNLLALRSLAERYAGKIKCVCIDPPYNTGQKEDPWSYSDNVDDPVIKKWLNRTVGAEGIDRLRHDKWCCMMYPRLKLLEKIMHSAGIIFVSIDDNEAANLIAMMNMIFGRKNFVGQLPTVMNLKGNNAEYGFAGTHEYTVVYVKDKKKAKFGGFEATGGDELEEWEEDEKGWWTRGAALAMSGKESDAASRHTMTFPVYVSKKDEINLERKRKTDKEVKPMSKGKAGRWRWGKKNQDWYTEIIVVRDKKNKNKITLYKKQRPGPGGVPSKKPKTTLYKPEYSSGNGTNLLKEMGWTSKQFNNPKPLELIKDLIMISSGKDDIILDSFAGSGTTAHAVLALNKKDGGNRKFILVELKDSHCQKITSKRVEKAIKGYTKKGTRVKVPPLGGDFEYYELEKKPIVEKHGKSVKIRSGTKFQDLARHIWFTETGTTLETRNIKKTFIGSHDGTNYYLLYPYSVKNELDTKFLKRLNRSEKNVVFAARCIPAEDKLKACNTSFREIPRTLKG